MKTKFSIFALLIVSCITARAQGVIHLGAGDSYLFSQPTQISLDNDDSGATYIVIRLGFTGDLFAPGDSLQIDVLSPATALTNLVMGTVSNPLQAYNGTSYAWHGVIWYNPLAGAVRLTMLSGSVDVSSVTGIADSRFVRQEFSYTIPEPDSFSLLLFSGAVLGGARWFARRKRSN